MGVVKKRRRRLKKQISIGIIVFCLAVAGGLGLLLTPIFNIDTITVTGNNSLATEDIVKGSGLNKGVNIFSVSLRDVQSRLSTMNGIDTVKVRRKFPSTIRIAVTEGTPLVWLESGGNLVGITAACKVVDVVQAGSGAASAFAAQQSAPPQKTAEADEVDEAETDDETDGANTDEGENENTDKTKTPSPQAADRTVVYGMGNFTYAPGQVIEFEDEGKGEKLGLLLNYFLCDDLCHGFTEVDMSVTDNVRAVYQGRLSVRIGEVARLEYKLKCFKKLITDNLGENSTGTLDLEQLIYSPKKF